MNFPEMPSANWAEQLPLLWFYFKWWIKEHQVWIMIACSFPIATALIQIVLTMFNRGDDEDDGYDVRSI